jgi:hypothetical protein
LSSTESAAFEKDNAQSKEMKIAEADHSFSSSSSTSKEEYEENKSITAEICSETSRYEKLT